MFPHPLQESKNSTDSKLPHPLSEAQLLQPAIDDLISNRIVEGIAALEAVRVKYGLKSSTQSR